MFICFRKWFAFSAVTAIAIVTLGVVFGTGGFAQGKPEPPFVNPADAPKPGATFQFVDGSTGKFRVPIWDDRVLSDQERSSNPVFNPAWEPFAQCVTGRGVDLQRQGTRPVDQNDLARLTERVNGESPRRDENLDLAGKRGTARADAVRARPHQQTAAIFLDCAEEWLSLSPSELFRKTGQPNDYYPPKP